MGIVIRPLEIRDRSAVREILSACGVFTGEEVRAALELIADFYRQGEDCVMFCKVLAPPPDP
jgi:enhancing lycopene biosynthesis protein 2